jgi:uncharacterized protein (DUF4415 family)
MSRQLIRPTPEEEAAINAAIAGDSDAAPELTEDWFRRAALRKGGRPKLAAPKEPVNIRLDPDVLAHFRSSGPGWQSRINEALRKAAGL